MIARSDRNMQPMTDDVLIFCNSPEGAQRVLNQLQTEFPGTVLNIIEDDIICNEVGNVWLRRRAHEIAVDERAFFVHR
jgi:hypothetical protein